MTVYFNFGKYNTKSVEEVAEKDPNYLVWFAGSEPRAKSKEVHDAAVALLKNPTGALLRYVESKKEEDKIVAAVVEHSKAVGNVGSEISGEYKVANVKAYWRKKYGRYDGAQEQAYIVNFVDKQGNLYVTFSASESVSKLVVGGVYRLKGKIKDHGKNDYKFKGAVENVVNYLKVEKVVKEPVAENSDGEKSHLYNKHVENGY